MDEASKLPDDGRRRKIRVVDRKVAQIGTVAVKAIQEDSSQSDLLFNLYRRELRKVGVFNGVGPSLGVGCAKSCISLLHELNGRFMAVISPLEYLKLTGAAQFRVSA